MALQPFVRPWPLFQFLELFTQLVGLLGRGISPSQGRYLHTAQHSTAQTQNKSTHTSMPRVGFEFMISVFERAKIVHALDLAATVVGLHNFQDTAEWKEEHNTKDNNLKHTLRINEIILGILNLNHKIRKT
jgi:hypothetical protein